MRFKMENFVPLSFSFSLLNESPSSWLIISCLCLDDYDDDFNLYINYNDYISVAFNILIKDDKMTLQLKGNVDLSETNDIKTALGAEPKAGFKFLTIQGEGLEYIDSSGVALMLFTKKLANEQNLMFEVESLSDNAQKVINLAGLANILKVKNIPKKC